MFCQHIIALHNIDFCYGQNMISDITFIFYLFI